MSMLGEVEDYTSVLSAIVWHHAAVKFLLVASTRDARELIHSRVRIDDRQQYFVA
jgi:hypothetical protein